MVGAGRCGICLATQKVYTPHRLAHLRLGWARQAGDKRLLQGKGSFLPVPPLRFAPNLELLASHTAVGHANRKPGQVSGAV